MTLIELMIASVILLSVSSICFEALVSLTSNDNRTESLVSNEQIVRFELDQLQRDIRASNFPVAFTSKSAYANQIEMQLGCVPLTAGCTATSQTVVRWSYDANPASPTYESLFRQVMSDATPSGTVTTSGLRLTNVRNVESSTPVFSYYGQHESDLVAGSFTASDVANCVIRVHILVMSDSSPGPLPFQEQLDVEVRNRLPGGVGCG